MSKSFSLNQLTEGIRERHLGADTSRLVSKWTRTGLLRGLQENKRETMARMLENQASQLLREANVLGSAGSAQNIDGFSNIAFPIVRRVFGGLVANELVSIQPMSLPSGLLFYLDYTYGSDIGHPQSGAGNAAEITDATDASVFGKGDSLYGNPSGNTVRTGADATGGMYDLAGSTYSRAYKTVALNDGDDLADGAISAGAHVSGVWTQDAVISVSEAKDLKLIGYDPQLVKEITEYSSSFQFLVLDISHACDDLDRTQAKGAGLIRDDGENTTSNGKTVWPTNDSSGTQWQAGTKLFNLRRLNQVGTFDATAHTFTPSVTGNDLLLVIAGDNSGTLTSDIADFSLSYPIADTVTTDGGGTGGVVTIPSFESDFGSSPAPIIPEIDIKIESIAVTAQTRKLRARWSPELAQDLNAYHSMDAEVELTQILSEQIALEIDREILNDLLVEAKAANYYWSRAPGKFVKKSTGAVASSTIGPAFHGTVREWYETLVETIIDVANEIHRKTLRGAANFIVVSPEVATVFEASVLYKPSIKLDGQGQASSPFSIGAEAIGSLSNRFTVYKDPYFPRNKILVGYKGGSYLESGYVYAPYVPLIVTPTIFAPEDFTPRKGVMTRYGKKMVRADFYGTVTCLDMDVI